MSRYSDKELLRASQIAYFLIDDDVIEELDKWLEDQNKTLNNYDLTINYTLSELYNHSDKFKKVYMAISAMYRG